MAYTTPDSCYGCGKPGKWTFYICDRCKQPEYDPSRPNKGKK